MDLNRIYEPAEDSYLLLDTLSSTPERQFLKERFGGERTREAQHAFDPSPIVFEVGTGSGVVLAFAAANAKTIFGRGDILALGADVNHFACQATKDTVVQACQGRGKDTTATALEFHGGATLLATLNADLTSLLRPRIIDVLIFNPPYVPSQDVPNYQSESLGGAKAPTGSFEDDSYLLSLSYEGGVDGMEVTNRLLEQLPYVLNSERGVAYILLCKQNRPEDVIKGIRGWGGQWSVEIVRRSGKVAGWEKLCVIRIWRN